jgi:serine protease Do
MQSNHRQGTDSRDRPKHNSSIALLFGVDRMRTRSRCLSGRLAAGMSMMLVAASGLIESPAAAAPTPAPSGPGHADSAVPQVTPQRRAIELVQPSVVLVRTDWRASIDTGDGDAIPMRWTSACTGVIVSSDGYVITAGHCEDQAEARRDAIGLIVDGLIDEGKIAASSRDKLVDRVLSGRDRWLVFGKDRDSPPIRENQIQLGGGVASWPQKKEPKDGPAARVIETVPFDQGDVALLKIDDTDLPVALLAQDKPQIGQELMAIGYPFEQVDGDKAAPVYQNGQINATDTEGAHGAENNFYQMSADLKQGMSGGPVPGLDGRVLGISSNTRLGKSSFIVPASIVADVLAKYAVKNELGRVDTLYRAGLDDFYRGYYTDAIRSFEQVVAIAPTHQMAKNKVREAADLRQRFGDQARPAPPTVSSGNKVLLWTLIVASVALLLALALGMTWFLRRRRSVVPAGEPVLSRKELPYRRDTMDDDTYVGYLQPLDRPGPFPPAYANESPVSPTPAFGSASVGRHSVPSTAEPAASPAPASPPPVSSPPAGTFWADTPSSGATPWSTPPASVSPASSVPVGEAPLGSWEFVDAGIPATAPEPEPGPTEFIGRAGVPAAPTPMAPPQPQAASFCSQCGAPRAASDRFCSSCGTRLGAPVVRPAG